MRRAALLALFLVSCGNSALKLPPPCTEDSECAAHQICFPEGCGDPGQGLVIEVTANSKSGHHAQDFAVPDLGLKPTYDLVLQPPMTLVGEIQRLTEPAALPTSVTAYPYAGALTVRAVGASALIPGVTRRYEASFSSLERGAYSMFIGAGNYTVTATAADKVIPPVVASDVEVTPGKKAGQDFLFQALGTTRTLSGRLLKSYTPGTPEDVTAITEGSIYVQLIDPESKRALSQPAEVASGDLVSKGEFTVYADPSFTRLESFQLLAMPKESAAPVPLKTFTLPRDMGQPLVLTMGDYGQLRQVTGQLRSSRGQPLPEATVMLEGRVPGGGTFRSKRVITDETGRFQVDVLPSETDAAYTVTMIPSPKSTSGIHEALAKVLVPVDGPARLEPELFTCPDRVLVTGAVVRPDGSKAAGVQVIAQPIAAIEGRALPPEPVEVYTDQEAQFTMYLDPADYRFDYVPGEPLPRRSRLRTIRAEPSDQNGIMFLAVDLGTFALNNGRKVSGLVSSEQLPAGAHVAVPNASIRFFRVTKVGGKESAVLLGQTVADDRGSYSVLLPTR